MRCGAIASAALIACGTLSLTVQSGIVHAPWVARRNLLEVWGTLAIGLALLAYVTTHYLLTGSAAEWWHGWRRNHVHKRGGITYAKLGRLTVNRSRNHVQVTWRRKR